MNTWYDIYDKYYCYSKGPVAQGQGGSQYHISQFLITNNFDDGLLDIFIDTPVQIRSEHWGRRGKIVPKIVPKYETTNSIALDVRHDFNDYHHITTCT